MLIAACIAALLIPLLMLFSGRVFVGKSLLVPTADRHLFSAHSADTVLWTP